MIVSIPIKPSLQQKMRITLVNNEYVLYFRWNDFLFAWVMDIHDNTDSPIINGISLVAGINLLDPYRYLTIGRDGGFVVLTNEPNFQPTFAGFGVETQLFYVTRI